MYCIVGKTKTRKLMNYFNPTGSFNVYINEIDSPFKPLSECSRNFGSSVNIETKKPASFSQKPFMAGMFSLLQPDPRKEPRRSLAYVKKQEELRKLNEKRELQN